MAMISLLWALLAIRNKPFYDRMDSYPRDPPRQISVPRGRIAPDEANPMAYVAMSPFQILTSGKLTKYSGLSMRNWMMGW